MSSPFQPLPGAGPPPRGLFIDRWGTLLDLPKQGFVSRFDQASFTPGALEALFRAGQAGWNLYLIGNEDSVAYGRLALEKWEAFEHELLEHLRSYGIPIRRCYSCTDNPRGVAPNDKDSVFLLPNTGILYHAAQQDGIILDQSWVVGDSTLELVAGWRASCRLAGVRTGLGLRDDQFPVDTEVLSDDLAGALIELTSGSSISR